MLLKSGGYMKKNKPEDIRWYVGDPCYAIDDERWHLFCERLFAVEHNEKFNGRGKSNGPLYIKWRVRERHNSYETKYDHTAEVWSSPGGDGTWNFNERDDLGNKISLGVDAGLLAVIPVSICEDNTVGDDSGAWFVNKPTLETDGHWGGCVTLNGNEDLSNTDCPQCGNREPSHSMEWCDALGESVCSGCWEEEE